MRQSIVRSVNKSFHTYLFISFLLIIGTGCNGGDETKPAQPSTNTYSGSVTAPGAAIAQLQNPTLGSSVMAMLFGTELQAAITGMTGVANATVEMIQIDDAGNQVGDVIATATTDSSGTYSLVTTASPGSDLVLKVSSSSATVRAFATSTSVDISPVSEYLVEKILATVASSSAITLDNFNSTELGLLMDFLNDLSVFLAPTTVADSISALDSVASVAGISSEIELYTPDGLMLAGTWYYQEYTGANTCGDPVGELWSAEYLTVTQSGNSLSVMSGSVLIDAVRLSGYSIVDLDLDTFSEGGGTLTETAMTLTVAPDGMTINGEIHWTWSSGAESCSGKSVVVLSKV